MGILSWVQSKINVRHEKKRPDAGSALRHAASQRQNEEFVDWPQGLLAIGTFGNDHLKVNDSQNNDSSGNNCPPQELPDFTLEEMNKLQKELTELLKSKPKPFQKACDDSDNAGGGNLSPITKVILRKETNTENHNAIKQISFSFLLRKLFACRGGFAITPSLRDPFPESRMEKMLATLLHKKIYPQNSAPASAKKYLKREPAGKSESQEDKIQQKADGSKWVKTDSEYIVLEI